MVQESPADERSFGELIFAWRTKKRIKRTLVLPHLPGWSKDMLYRLEKGELAPAYDQLRPLFRALCLAGVPIPPDGPQLYVQGARLRSERKRTHLDAHTEEEWSELTYDLGLIAREFAPPDREGERLAPVLLLDTEHLVGRLSWRQEVLELLTWPERCKLLIIGGPSGIGKTSEINRLARHLLATHRVVICDFQLVERIQGSEEALEVFLGSAYSALGQPPSSGSLEGRVLALLETIENTPVPIVFVLDHAESMFHVGGKLALCWERFLSHFLRYQHRCSIAITTKQWPGWFSGGSRFIAEKNLPPLTRDEGVLLLKQLGLKEVPDALLAAIVEKVGGLPLCMEWVATLVKQPVFWDEDPSLAREPSPLGALSQAVERLLEEPHVFADVEELAPLLEGRILSDYHLSTQARDLAEVLSLASVPLAKHALDILSPQWMRVLPELRRASLLASYHDRMQIVPSVGAAVLRSLSFGDRLFREKNMIKAYQNWVRDGTFYENEKGAVVTALATLLLSHHQLLAAAELLVRHGWMAFHLGYAIRLARLAQTSLSEEYTSRDEQAGALLLHYFLSPHLAMKIDVAARAAHYQRLLEWILDGSVDVEPPTEVFIVRHLMFWAMDLERFVEAQHLIDDCEERLGRFVQNDPDLQASLLEKRGFLLTRWCEYAAEQGDLVHARMLREQGIAVYRQSITLLNEAQTRTTPLKSGILKKRLARAQTNLGFHLSRMGQFGEAIQVLKQSIYLKEQGFAEPGSLAASYGDLSQALAGLGDLQGAVRYDELAMGEIRRLADAGDTVQQEAAWTYWVNRARLYVRLGRLDEAEALLLEALPYLPERWRMFRVFAQEALEQIQHLRVGSLVPAQDVRERRQNDTNT